MYNVFLAVYNTLLAAYLSYYFALANNRIFVLVWGLSAVVYSPAIFKAWKAYKKSP